MLGETTVLGRAIVREASTPPNTEPVSCVVTLGIIARSAFVRVIRDGISIYPAPEQKACLEVLSAVSGDDMDEIGQMLNCSLHVRGFKTLRAGDVVEAYRITPE